MKAKAILLALGLFTVVFGAQDTVKFTRNFKEGDSDTYKMHITATTAMGDADVSMNLTQTVKKLYDNGEADMETAVKDMKVIFNGNEMPVPPTPAKTQHVDKRGIPIGAQGAGDSLSRMQFMRYAGLFYDRDLKVGDNYPIDITDPKNPKMKTTGNVKFDSLANGEAKLISDIKVFTGESDKPMSINATTLVEAGSGKMNRVEGSATDLPVGPGGPPVTAVKFVMERVK
jgi:hypothetical protein